MIRLLMAWLGLMPPQPRPRLAPLLPERTEIVIDTPEQYLAPELWDRAVVEPLVQADRCDCCSAQAHVRVRLRETALRLDLCGHHYNKHALMLMADGWSVEQDTRESLLARPGASA